jgi:hypothetical protein
MYWYDPTIHASERVAAPSNDDEAVRMLAGRPDSARLVSEYADLRRTGAPIERALVLVGHEERLREHDLAPMRLAWRERPSRKRPSAEGYELLLAARLGEESGDRRGGTVAPGRGYDANPHVRTSENPIGAKSRERALPAAG